MTSHSAHHTVAVYVLVGCMHTAAGDNGGQSAVGRAGPGPRHRARTRTGLCGMHALCVRLGPLGAVCGGRAGGRGSGQWAACRL